MGVSWANHAGRGSAGREKRGNKAVLSTVSSLAKGASTISKNLDISQQISRSRRLICSAHVKSTILLSLGRLGAGRTSPGPRASMGEQQNQVTTGNRGARKVGAEVRDPGHSLMITR